MGSIVKGHLSFPIAALFSVVSALVTFNCWGSRRGEEGMRSWKLVGKWEEKQINMWGQGDHSEKQTHESKPGVRLGEVQSGNVRNKDQEE